MLLMRWIFISKSYVSAISFQLHFLHQPFQIYLKAQKQLDSLLASIYFAFLISSFQSYLAITTKRWGNFFDNIRRTWICNAKLPVLLIIFSMREKLVQRDSYTRFWEFDQKLFWLITLTCLFLTVFMVIPSSSYWV